MSKLKPLFLSLLVTGTVPGTVALRGTQVEAEPAPIVQQAMVAAPVDIDTDELETTLQDLQDQWKRKEAIGETSLRLHIQADRIRTALCENGKKKYCPLPAAPVLAQPILVDGNLDLDKLARAVAEAETSGCTAGTGKAPRNNCFGIRRNGAFMEYEKTEDSFEDFKAIWARSYGRFPTLEDAKRYTDGEGIGWLATVTTVYNRQQ